MYVGPFATAVKRVKVRAAGSAGWHRWCSSPSGHGTIRLPAPDFIFARPSPCPSSHGAESVAVQLRMRAGCGSRHPGAGCCRHHHHRQGVHRGHPGHLWRLHDGPGAPGGQGSVSIRRKRQGWQAGSAWCSVASKRVGARAQPWLPAGRPSTHPSPTRHSKHPLPSSLAPPRAPPPPPRPFRQLSWFTQPYVQQLRYERGSDTLEATTLTLLARPRTDRFHIAEVGEVQGVHPLSSFQVRRRPTSRAAAGPLGLCIVPASTQRRRAALSLATDPRCCLCLGHSLPALPSLAP